MHDGDLLIEHLVAGSEEQPREIGVCTGADELDVVGDATVRGAEVERSGLERAAGVLRDLDAAEVDLRRRHVLQEHVLECGVVGQRDGRADVRAAELGAGTDPRLDHGGRTAGTEVDHDTRARCVVRRVGKLDVDDVDRRIERDAVSDVDDRAVTAVRDVERDEGIDDVVVGPLEVLGDPFGPFGQDIGQTRHAESVGAREVRSFDVDHAVDHDDARAVEHGHLLVEIGWHVGARLDRGAERQLAQGSMRGISPRFVALGRVADRTDPVERVETGLGRRIRVDRHDGAPVSGRSGASSRSWLTKSA